jgi:urease accessory protein
MPEVDGSALPLLIWTSPAFPIGAFTYSHGLETAVDDAVVTNVAGLEAWLRDLLVGGAVRNDAVLAAAAWRAERARDVVALREVNELALALVPSRERHVETVGQGNAFAAAIRAAWPAAAAAWPEGDLAYPVAFGAACGAARVPLRPTLEGFALGFIQNLVSAAIRLGAVGQTDGQRVTAAVLGDVQALAAAVEPLTLDEIGGCAQRSDIMALRHETLYSRLFRS